MQLLVRNVTSRLADTSRVTEPVALAVVAVLLLVIATAQYRSVAAWGEVDRERGERRWNDTVERAAGGLNASVSELYAQVVSASQRNELADGAALTDLLERWRARTDFGSFVDAADGYAHDANGEMPFVASWVATPDGLPALQVSLPGASLSMARFIVSHRACERMREVIAEGRVAPALPEVEVAIAPPAGAAGRGCATRGYDAGRPPEASAAIFRLGLPGRGRGAPVAAFAPAAGIVSRSASPGLAPQWQLQLQRRGGSLGDALARGRQRTLWATAASELLLIAAVAVMALGGWRAHRRARAHLAVAAAVAHELRTPLAALKVLGQNQARGIVRGEQQLAQYGAAVASEADRLHAFVERVLQFASGRARAVPLAVVPIECERLVQAALEPLRDRVRQVGLEVRTRLPVPPLRVCGDEPSLVLALRNLLQNVLDHAEGARHVELTIAVRGQYLEFTVADDGAGVPAPDRRSLFEPFVRGRVARQRRTAGQGLGLAMVADVAAMHRGMAWFEPASGQTTFGFRIRLDLEGRVAPRPGSGQAA